MEGTNVLYGVRGLRGSPSGQWRATNSGHIPQENIPNQSSVTGASTTTATPEQIGQMIADAYAQQIAEAQAQQGMEPDTITLSEAIIVVGGVIVIIHYMNKAIRTAYFEAAGYLDEVQNNPDRQGGWAHRLVSWLEQGLRTLWVPLWFNHEEIRAQAAQRNQTRAAQAVLQPNSQAPILRQQPTPHPSR